MRLTDRVRQALLGPPVDPTPPHLTISSGWACLDSQLGGGYPERRVTHIHGPLYQTLELTRGWGPVVRLTTIQALQRFHFNSKPERLIVDCTSLQGPQTWQPYVSAFRNGQGRLPSTVVWLTAGPAEALPKALKFFAYLRLTCSDDQVHIVKNRMSPSLGTVELPGLGSSCW